MTHHAAWLRGCDELLLLRPGGGLARLAPEQLHDGLSLASTLLASAASDAAPPDAPDRGTPPEADERSHGGGRGKGGGRGAGGVRGAGGKGAGGKGAGGKGTGGSGGGGEGGGGYGQAAPGSAGARDGGAGGGNGGGGGGGGGSGGSGRLVQRERLARGGVARSVWATYARSLGPAAPALLL